VFDKAKIFEKTPWRGRQRVPCHRALERSVPWGSRLWTACDQGTGKVDVDARFLDLERSCARRRNGISRYEDVEMRCDEPKMGCLWNGIAGVMSCKRFDRKRG
jgi:hypothetical protein